MSRKGSKLGVLLVIIILFLLVSRVLLRKDTAGKAIIVDPDH